MAAFQSFWSLAQMIFHGKWFKFYLNFLSGLDINWDELFLSIEQRLGDQKRAFYCKIAKMYPKRGKWHAHFSLYIFFRLCVEPKSSFMSCHQMKYFRCSSCFNACEHLLRLIITKVFALCSVLLYIFVYNFNVVSSVHCLFLLFF